MTIDFNLVKGMSGEDILTELNGRVSGETRELYQTFATPAKNHADVFKDQLHKIIATGEANGQQFAIIEKIHTFAAVDNVGKVIKDVVSPNRVKVIKTERSYFLSGINDEGTYFVHPLEYDSIKTYWRTGDMQMVLDQINRTGDGFDRIQGDVLTKEFEDFEIIRGDKDQNGIEDVTLDENNEHMNLVDRNMEVRNELERFRRERMFDSPFIDNVGFPATSSSRTVYVASENKSFDLTTGDEVIMTQQQKNNTREFTALDMTKEEHDEEYVKHMEEKKYGIFSDGDDKKGILSNPLPIFGNHFLYTDAKQIYAGANGVLLIHPTVIALEHNEHKAVKFHPNNNKNVFLTTQRGVTAIEGQFVGYD